MNPFQHWTPAQVAQHNAGVGKCTSEGDQNMEYLSKQKAEKKPIRSRSNYKPEIVCAYFITQGLPAPVFEYRFHPTRKWRFDLAWPNRMVALEVDGGIWIAGGHNRGAQIKATWEKENDANIFHWCLLKCEPRELCTQATVELIRRAIDSSKQ